MNKREMDLDVSRHLRKPGTFAVAFFILAAALLTVAIGCAWLATLIVKPDPNGNRSAFIVSFLVSTGLLTVGSIQLIRATGFVKRERQREFRQCLTSALTAGTAFVSVQTYGLYSLITLRTDDFATGVRHAAFVFIMLHAVHVVIALLFLVYIRLQALTDRYDHEYSLGITFCSWFWHGLGIAWAAILAVFTVAGTAAMAH
ncbi:MAG: hypothetical protein MK102_16325 [Fuerstiella sp.]|nr:hypothetical protein [Fuerstiella sp.]